METSSPSLRIQRRGNAALHPDDITDAVVQLRQGAAEPLGFPVGDQIFDAAAALADADGLGLAVFHALQLIDLASSTGPPSKMSICWPTR